jgi:hypothetical protein
MTKMGRQLAQLAATSFGDGALTGGGGGNDGNHQGYRFGVYTEDNQTVTFTRVKFAEAEGPDFKDSDFNDRDDLIPVSVETFNFQKDKWEPNQPFINKINSGKHRFLEAGEFLAPGESLLLQNARAAYKSGVPAEKPSGLDNV